jgi:hypothetical protein
MIEIDSATNSKNHCSAQFTVRGRNLPRTLRYPAVLTVIVLIGIGSDLDQASRKVLLVVALSKFQIQIWPFTLLSLPGVRCARTCPSD